MKKILLTVTALMFGTVGLANADIWSVNGNDYGIIAATDDNYSWQAAATAAEAMGGHLATFGDAAEWSFVQDLTGFGSGLWLGGYQDTDSPLYQTGWNGDDVLSAWTWVDGTEWSYTAWADGEPNDGSGWYYENNDEDFLMTWHSGDEWNDMPGAGNYGYVYEIEASSEVPEPGTMLLMGFGLAGLVGYNRKRSNKKA